MKDHSNFQESVHQGEKFRSWFHWLLTQQQRQALLTKDKTLFILLTHLSLSKHSPPVSQNSPPRGNVFVIPELCLFKFQPGIIFKVFSGNPQEESFKTLIRSKLNPGTTNLLMKYSFLLHLHLVKVPARCEHWSSMWRNVK